MLAGVMVAGRVGGALTAELGTMRVTAQSSALAGTGAAPADPASGAGFEAGGLWLSRASLGDASPAAREWRARRNLVNAGKALLAAVGAGLLGWGAWRRLRGRRPRASRLHDRGLALLGVLGFAAWWNFGLFHYPDFVHPHELFHYVIGAKYFPELGYTRLYECVAIADSRVRGGSVRSAGRRLRNLETNIVEIGRAHV